MFDNATWTAFTFQQMAKDGTNVIFFAVRLAK